MSIVMVWHVEIMAATDMVAVRRLRKPYRIVTSYELSDQSPSADNVSLFQRYSLPKIQISQANLFNILLVLEIIGSLDASEYCTGQHLCIGVRFDYLISTASFGMHLTGRAKYLCSRPVFGSSIDLAGRMAGSGPCNSDTYTRTHIHSQLYRS